MSTDSAKVVADFPAQTPSEAPSLLRLVCAVPLSPVTRPIADTISCTVCRSPGAGSNPRFGYFDELIVPPVSRRLGLLSSEEPSNRITESYP